MAISRIQISAFLPASRGQLLLDVRSPAEYEHARIPGAISFPLFSNEERKVVGTAYKQESREKAIRIGLDYFGPKMRTMVERVEALLEEMKQPKGPVYVYCWRGGMRSSAVAWLLDLYGFKVFTLAGGYKAYRNYVLSSFTLTHPIQILGGYTGSGKTEVLGAMKAAGESVIDLENLASHKGSAFGSFMMPPQPSQEMFENLLSEEIDRLTTDPLQNGNNRKPVWMEDESQRIGNVNIPGALWQQMRNSPISFLDIPFEERLEHLVSEYGKCDPAQLIESVKRISKRLGPLETKNTVQFLESRSFKDAFRILLQYYDKSYLRGLHNRDQVHALLTMIPSDRVDPSNSSLLTKLHPV